MADQRVPTPAGSRSAVRRHVRTSSQSPTRHPQRIGDDLLSQLSPNSAVDALRSPTGALKKCMDLAPASEQAFAMRTAIASKKIRDWLDELSSWPWPKESASAGFEMPPPKRRRVTGPVTPEFSRINDSTKSDPPFDTDYLGSLPAAEVERYEKRVEQIRQDLDDLDLEEIKSQVLHNHILPLSRPGTPFSEGDRSLTSTLMFAKMEDLTAVITAIIIQALPNLSRLARMLNTWTIRFLVLRKVPSLYLMITDAEVALRSGWSAIEPVNSSPTRRPGYDSRMKEKLSRKDFEVMKRVIQQKVTKPGRALDYMLDALEGSMDTLPDEWLDRMEKIERDYALWESTAERKVRGDRRSGLMEVSSPGNGSFAEPETPQPKIKVQSPSPGRDSDTSQFASPPMPSNYSPEIRSARVSSMPNPGLSKQAFDPSSKRSAVKFLIDMSAARSQYQPDTSSAASVGNPGLSFDGTVEGRRIKAVPTSSKPASAKSNHAQLTQAKQPRNVAHDKVKDSRATGSGQISPVLGEVDRNIVRNPPLESKLSGSTAGREPASTDDLESSVLEPSILEPVDEEEDELELPPARFEERRGSRASTASTVIHGPAGGFIDSDNMSFREGSMEPDLPRLPDPDEPFSSDAISPPSSPPLRYKVRSTSVTFKNVPEIAPLPEARSTPPRSPAESPDILDRDGSFEYDDSQMGSPSRMSTMSSMSEDEHLQQQISELLESIPARIRLKRTPGVNLNPPDFQPPSQPKSKTSNATWRSGSSLSSRGGTPSFSRSGTPSFMLAPAREPRPRSKSSQGIRVYHLTRSTGEPPLKLLIRCVGERGERVMVRIGGGWADLGEYLREYAIHHSSRSRGEGKVDIKDLQNAPPNTGSSPSSRPGSAMGSPGAPLAVRKTRRSLGSEGAPKFANAQFSNTKQEANTPISELSILSRTSSHLDWDEEDSSLGLAGPKGKRVDMSDESRAWVESVKEKVRIASGDRVVPPEQRLDTRFGEMGKVGGTKRLFRKH